MIRKGLMQMNGEMLDTNVIIKYLAGDETAKLLIDNASEISVPVIVVGELQYGAQKSSRVNSNIKLFADFLSNFTIIHVDENIAAVYGKQKSSYAQWGSTSLKTTSGLPQQQSQIIAHY